MILCLVFFYSCGPKPNNIETKFAENSYTDLQRLGLQGKVKSVKETTISIHNSDSSLVTPVLRTFDAHGLVTAYYIFHDSVPELRYKYDHDIVNGLLKRSHLVKDTCSYTSYEYANQGVKEIKEYSCKNDTSQLESRTIRTYDQRGRILVDSQFTTEFEPTVISYIQDSAGAIIRQEWRGHNPSNRGMNEYGDMTYYARNRSDGVYDSVVYRLKYDSHENWIEKWTINPPDSNSEYGVIREIEYRD